MHPESVLRQSKRIKPESISPLSTARGQASESRLPSCKTISPLPCSTYSPKQKSCTASRFREKAVRSLHFTEAELDEADAACVQRIADAKRFALESPYPDAADYQKYLYAD